MGILSNREAAAAGSKVGTALLRGNLNRPEPDDPANPQPANVNLINIDPPTEEEC